MNNSSSLNLQRASLYTDFQGLNELKRGARDHSREALTEVAKQFEAIFMQMMLKSMRDASQVDGLLDSQQGDVYTDMYDKQLTNNLSGQGGGMGLADVIVRQLEQTLPPEERAQQDEGGQERLSQLSALPPRGDAAFSLLPPSSKEVKREEERVEAISSELSLDEAVQEPVEPQFATTEDFVHQLLPLAQKAGKALGLDPDLLLAQAALETGWGKKVIRSSVDGSNSYNLFNIKADERWDGDAIAKQTLEFRGGVAQRERASFRAYSGYEESFNDYVSFLRSNPRYQEALQQVGDPHRYLTELHRAGYATDPDYVTKIERILERDIFSDDALLALKTR
ncbi:MAG: flagellar assembly peptidoglycan hydrolase FlgJ [Gammaproteobacteria bacterium]|nr:flagellar assembly peptidoglycan hydrolase FlgJ [Gammaproteobacteria bacterium]